MIDADLGPELEAIVLDLIESGKYASRAQVLRESDELRGWRELKRREFDELIQSRLATPSDEYIPVEEVFERLYRDLGIQGDGVE